MELFQQTSTSNDAYTAPPIVATYAPIFWEPLPGTNERIVALISLEPKSTGSSDISPATYVVLAPERLRAMLGRQRGNASIGILREISEFLTRQQIAGKKISDISAQFHGITIGPQLTARGYSTQQLIDAAVRSISAFGKADDLVDEEESKPEQRHTLTTAEFIRVVRREVAGDDLSVRARFDKSFSPKSGLPELTIDYAFQKWMLQVTSLPATPRQALNSLRESQSKLYEIDTLRKYMRGTSVSPILLLNEDALYTSDNEAALNEARKMKDRLEKLAKYDGVEIINAASAFEAADLIVALDQ